MSFKNLVSNCKKKIDQKWNLKSLTDYDEIQQLSSTIFGEVLVIKQKFTNHIFALKKISFEKLSNYNQSQIIDQLQNLIDLQSPKILKFYGYYIDIKQQQICYLLELMDYNLEQYCQQNDKFPEEMVIKIFTELVEILTELKKQGIVHGNLKPENILLNEKKEIKVGDIGNGKFCEDSKTLMAETLMFAAPEVSKLFSNEIDIERILMSGKNIFTHSSDIFTLGLIILRITGGIVAKFSIRNLLITNNNNQQNNIDKLINDYIETVPGDIRSIVKEMLSFEVEKRPGIDEIQMKLMKRKEIEVEEVRQFITEQSQGNNNVMDLPKEQQNKFSCNGGCNCQIF